MSLACILLHQDTWDLRGGWEWEAIILWWHVWAEVWISVASGFPSLELKAAGVIEPRDGISPISFRFSETRLWLSWSFPPDSSNSYTRLYFPVLKYFLFRTPWVATLFMTELRKIVQRHYCPSSCDYWWIVFTYLTSLWHFMLLILVFFYLFLATAKNELVQILFPLVSP